MVNDHVQRVIEILERTPNILREWLDGLPDRWTQSNYGPDTFSPWDVLAHLLHCEHTDWPPRVRHILAHGDDPPFNPYVIEERGTVSNGKSIEQLLDEFESMREASLDELRALDLKEEQLRTMGTHPALGPVSLGELLNAWAVHDLHHIAQIGKCLARQFDGEVGVFEAYLGILSRSH